MSWKRQKPLVEDKLLIKNVNTWGNVQYNIPLRLSNNETRTATSIGLREIQPVSHALDCKINTPLPERVTGRDMLVEKETYRTTSGEYRVQPNPNKAMERADVGMNCRRVAFMTGVDKQIQRQTITQPLLLSEMKASFRGATRQSCPVPDAEVQAPDPEYIFDAVASGRAEAKCITDSDGGYARLLDPYVSTYRAYHRPFTDKDWWGIGAKDHITFYSEAGLPKVKGFGPRYNEIWMPQLSKVHRNVYDRIHVKKECKPVAASHNCGDNIKGIFKSETKSKFQIPYAVSPLASWSHGEEFNLPPFPPNPYQTNAAPFMYCSDYCHISAGTPPSTVVDQLKIIKPHKPCPTRYIVSTDETIPMPS